MNGKKKVHKNFCCLEPLLLGSLKSIYLLQYQICCWALRISVRHDKEISHSLQKISPGTLFSYVKALKVQSLFHSSLNEMKAWISYEIDLLHAISCRDRGNIGLQTSFKEFQISHCPTDFQLIHFVFCLASLISPLLLMSKQDLFLLLCLDYQVN